MSPQISNFIKILNTTFTSVTHQLEDPDWNALCRIAQSQSVIALFHEGASKYPEFVGAPAELQQRLFEQSVISLAGQARRTEEFLGIYQALLEAGIRPLVVKGIVCRHTYGSLCDHRPSGDEDIYVKKEEFEACRKILTTNGCIMDESKNRVKEVSAEMLEQVQEITFKTAGGLSIEVHMNLFGKETENRRKLNLFFENAFEHAVSVAVSEDGRKVWTMEPTANYLFLFLHMYKHFTFSGVGIRQIMDMALFDRSYHEQIDFAAVEEAILKMNAGKLYADALKIGEMLGLPVATGLTGDNPKELILDMMESGVFGNSSEAHHYSSYVTTSAMGGEQEGKVSLLRSVFPSASQLLRGYPILERRPWLLPFIWVKRLWKFLIKDRKAKKGGESVRIGKKRVALMKKYGIVK